MTTFLKFKLFALDDLAPPFGRAPTYEIRNIVYQMKGLDE
jgi:hypothetical protein